MSDKTLLIDVGEDLQRTAEWHKARRGKPSASSANKLLTPTGKASEQYLKYAYELAADVWIDGRSSETEFAGTVWTERGTELEPHARAAFELAKDLDVEQCGVLMSPCGRYCASPDGLVGKSGVLEIKCQKKAGHVASLMHVERTFTVPPEYANQMRMQMLVSGRSVGYFVAYHPYLPLVIAQIERDSSIESTLVEQIEKTLAARDEAIDVMSIKSKGGMTIWEEG